MSGKVPTNSGIIRGEDPINNTENSENQNNEDHYDQEMTQEMTQENQLSIIRVFKFPKDYLKIIRNRRNMPVKKMKYSFISSNINIFTHDLSDIYLKFEFSDNIFNDEETRTLAQDEIWTRTKKKILFKAIKDGYKTIVLENVSANKNKAKNKYWLSFTKQDNQEFVEILFIYFDDNIKLVGNNTDINKQKIFYDYKRDDKKIFSLEKDSTGSPICFEFKDGLNVTDFPFFMLNVTLWHWNNIKYHRKPTAAVATQETENIYDNDWIIDNYGKPLTLSERPLQGAFDDTCLKCSLITCAIGLSIRFPIDYFKYLNFGSKRIISIKRTLDNVGVKTTKLNEMCYNTTLKRTFENAKNEGDKKLHLLYLLMEWRASEMHCCYATQEWGSNAKFYNSWRKEEVEAYGGFNGVTLFDAKGCGTYFEVMSVYKLKKKKDKDK